MSNNNEEMERKRRFAELKKRAEEAEKNKNPIRRDKPAVQTGVGSDKFKAASSTLAGVFGAPKTTTKPEATKVTPPAQQGISSAMKERQAALERARQLDAERAKSEAAKNEANTAPSAGAAAVAPEAPPAPDAPDAPSAPMAPAAPSAPSAPDAPNAAVPSLADVIKARREARTPEASGTTANQVENKGAKPAAAGPAITEDAIRNVGLKKVTVERAKPAASAGGVNFAMEAAKRRAEMEKRRAEGGGTVAPKVPAATVTPKLTEAQLKAQERAARAAQKPAGTAITPQAQNASKAANVSKGEDEPTRPRSGGMSKR